MKIRLVWGHQTAVRVEGSAYGNILHGKGYQMRELGAKTVPELLDIYNKVLAALREKKVIKTKNLVGDYTEWLVCECLSLEPQRNSKAGFDAVDPKTKRRYQIKGRRDDRSSVQFSAVRNYEQRDFAFLILVAFWDDFSVRFAVSIPYEHVGEFIRWQSHTNAHNPTLRCDDVKRLVNERKAEDIGYRLTRALDPIDPVGGT